MAKKLLFCDGFDVTDTPGHQTGSKYGWPFYQFYLHFEGGATSKIQGRGGGEALRVGNTGFDTWHYYTQNVNINQDTYPFPTNDVIIAHVDLAIVCTRPIMTSPPGANITSTNALVGIGANQWVVSFGVNLATGNWALFMGDPGNSTLTILWEGGPAPVFLPDTDPIWTNIVLKFVANSHVTLAMEGVTVFDADIVPLFPITGPMYVGMQWGALNSTDGPCYDNFVVWYSSNHAESLPTAKHVYSVNMKTSVSDVWASSPPGDTVGAIDAHNRVIYGNYDGTASYLQSSGVGTDQAFNPDDTVSFSSIEGIALNTNLYGPDGAPTVRGKFNSNSLGVTPALNTVGDNHYWFGFQFQTDVNPDTNAAWNWADVVAGAWGLHHESGGAVYETYRYLEIVGSPGPAPPAPLRATCPIPNEITYGVAYSNHIGVTGGTSPYFFSLNSAGALPPGLTLDEDTGEISGTPTEIGNFPYIITVTDSATDSDPVVIDCELDVEYLTCLPTPIYVSSRVLDRFPDDAFETTMLAQDQKFAVLTTITAKTAGYPVMYLADRRMVLDNALFQPRLLKWAGISQRIDGQTDLATFTFGNADRVMTLLSADVDLFRAKISFSLFHFASGVRLDIWSGEIASYSSPNLNEFVVRAVDGIFATTLQYPNQLVLPACSKNFDDGKGCPWSTVSGVGDPTGCDRGYDTDNGCKAHGMKRYFGGMIASPQTVRVKDNSTGFFGIGRNDITSTSLVSDSIQGLPLADIYTDIPMSAQALVFAGRDEGDFYEAGGLIGSGPLGAYGQGTVDINGNVRFHTLDGQPNHGSRNDPNNSIVVGSAGLREILGTDPAGVADQISLDQAGIPQVLDNFSGGIAFLVIRRTDQSGLQVSPLDEHSMIGIVGQGLKGWVWTAPGARTEQLLTNPVWVAVNVYLKGSGNRYADLATAESLIDVPAAVTAAAICDTSVQKIIGEGNEPQFKFLGRVADKKVVRDWVQEILNTCCGVSNFRNSKLRIIIRADANEENTFNEGNMIAGSLVLSPIAPAFNRLTMTFANSDYEFVQDALPVQSTDHIAYLGQIVDSEFAIAGASGKSIAGRIGLIRLKENLGGSTFAEWKQARQASFTTTIMALRGEPGKCFQIVHEDVPTGTGKFRMRGWELKSDFSVAVDAITVTDSMYDVTEGNLPADNPATSNPGGTFFSRVASATKTPTAKQAGAPADGNSHPASGNFPDLPTLKASYPNAKSLDDELDLLVVENLAKTGAQTVSLGAGQFRFNRPLELVGGDVTLTGADPVTGITTILGDTGSAVLDLHGAQKAHVQNLDIRAIPDEILSGKDPLSKPSIVGIILGANGSDDANGISFSNVSVKLASSGSIINPSVGIYIHGGKDIFFDGIDITADIPVVIEETATLPSADALPTGADLVCIDMGDSLTWGTPVSSGGPDSYPGQLATLLGITTHNLGVPGAVSAGVLSTQVPAAIALFDLAKTNLVTCMIGVNDLNTLSVATLQAHVSSIVSAIQGAGGEIMMITILACDPAGEPGDFQAKLAAYNAWLIGGGSGANWVADLTGVPELSDPNNATFFQSDKLHLKIPGYGVVAEKLAAQPRFDDFFLSGIPWADGPISNIDFDRFILRSLGEECVRMGSAGAVNFRSAGRYLFSGGGQAADFGALGDIWVGAGELGGGDVVFGAATLKAIKLFGVTKGLRLRGIVDGYTSALLVDAAAIVDSGDIDLEIIDPSEPLLNVAGTLDSVFVRVIETAGGSTPQTLFANLAGLAAACSINLAPGQTIAAALLSVTGLTVSTDGQVIRGKLGIDSQVSESTPPVTPTHKFPVYDKDGVLLNYIYLYP